MVAAAGGVTVAVTGADFGAVARALRAADPQLRRDLSRDVRAITTPIVADMRMSVLGLSTTGGGSPYAFISAYRQLDASIGEASARRATYRLSKIRGVRTDRQIEREFGRSGLRAAIAQATRAVQQDRGNSVGVRVYVNSTYLPPDQRKLPRHMNRGQWRHPVFGNKNVWVTQTVSPEGWFSNVAHRHRADAYARFNATVEHHARRLAARIDAAG